MLAFLPLLLIVCSNTLYHLTSKSTPSGANSFASLFVTYTVAALLTLVCLLFQTHSKGLLATFQQLNWTSFVLGLTIIGLEFGNIQAYRMGWNLSTCSLLSNVALGIILFCIGVLFYREQVTKNQFLGIVLCLFGIFFLNRK